MDGKTLTSYSTTTMSQPGTLLGCLIALLLGYLLLGAIYRVFLHPLSRIPGPKLAALTHFYEFYHDVVRGGTYVKSFARLHNYYKSPVIRISPNHVHVHDPAFYKQLTRIGSEFYKDPSFYETNGFFDSILTTTDPLKHRYYRRMLNPQFDSRSIKGLAPNVVSICQDATSFMLRQSRKEVNHGVDIGQVYRCITADLIYTKLFGKPLGLFNDTEYPDLLACLDKFTDHFMLANLPAWLANRISPGYQATREQFQTWIQEYRTERARTKSRNLNTIVDLLLDNNATNPANANDTDIAALTDHTFIFVVAGTDTTGFTLTAATFYILSHPAVLDRLSHELDDADLGSNGDFAWAKATTLPYLTAIIKETLRLYTIAATPLPRIVPKGGVRVGQYFLPGGTKISQSIYTLHHDASVFEKPEEFIPERWLHPLPKTRHPNFAPFSRGTRSCIGIHLAYMEMYTCLAYIFSRFKMHIIRPAPGYLAWHDHGTAVPDSKVEVRVVKDRWA